MDLEKWNRIYNFILSPKKENDRQGECMVILAIAFFILLFCLPLFSNIHKVSQNDEWLSAFCLNRISRWSILKFHQIPFWTPYAGGGFTIYAHPYLGFLHPFFGLVILFGEIIGLKISIVLIYILGSIGMYTFTRDYLKYSRLGSLFSSLAYAFCSYLPSMLADGNYFHIHIFLLPLILKFFTVPKKSYILYTAFFLASIIFQSGFFLFVSIIFLSFFTILFDVPINISNNKNTFFTRIKKLIFVLIITLGLSSVFTLPMLNLLGKRAQPVHSYSEDTYSEIKKMANSDYAALTWKQLICSLFKIKCPHMMPTMHFGYITIALFILSAFLFWKANFKWMIILIFFLFLSFGPNSPIDIFAILWHLHPFFHFIYKCNKYFSIGIIFTISIVAGRIFTTAASSFSNARSFKYSLIVFFLLFIFFASLSEQFVTNRIYLANIFTMDCPKKNIKNCFYQVAIQNLPFKRELVNQYHYYFILNNIGLINWHSNIRLQESAIPKYYIAYNQENIDYSQFTPSSLIHNPLYKGEAFFKKKDNTAKLLRFSPNVLSMEVAVNTPDWLVINQNYHPYWKADYGKVENINGLLGIRLNKPGNYTVVLHFIPLDFYIGLLISIITLLASLWFIFGREKSLRTVEHINT